jgi:hypothetical protein
MGGRPVLLTLTVRGEGSVETVPAPRLADESGFRAGVPEQEEKSRFEGGRLLGEKTFRVPLRPESRHVKEVPPAELVVFDPAEERYVTLRTGAIPITVTLPEDTGAVETLPLPAEARRTAREPVREDIEDIETGADAGDSHAARLHGPLGLAVLCFLPLAVYAALAVVARRRRMLREDRALARRLSAARTARARLDELRSAGEGLGPGEFASRLSRALQGYVADRAGRPSGEIAPKEAAQLLCEGRAGDDCAREAESILSDLEAARFGGAGLDRGRWLNRVGACVDTIEKGTPR